MPHTDPEDGPVCQFESAFIQPELLGRCIGESILFDSVRLYAFNQIVKTLNSITSPVDQLNIPVALLVGLSPVSCLIRQIDCFGMLKVSYRVFFE